MNEKSVNLSFFMHAGRYLVNFFTYANICEDIAEKYSMSFCQNSDFNLISYKIYFARQNIAFGMT